MFLNHYPHPTPTPPASLAQQETSLAAQSLYEKRLLAYLHSYSLRDKLLIKLHLRTDLLPFLGISEGRLYLCSLPLLCSRVPVSPGKEHVCVSGALLFICGISVFVAAMQGLPLDCLASRPGSPVTVTNKFLASYHPKSTTLAAD